MDSFRFVSKRSCRLWVLQVAEKQQATCPAFDIASSLAACLHFMFVLLDIIVIVPTCMKCPIVSSWVGLVPFHSSEVPSSSATRLYASLRQERSRLMSAEFMINL
jgi:hypothetical protein